MHQVQIRNSDTSWTKPTEPSPTLADAKGSCLGVKPAEPAFATDFAAVVRNVRQLEDIVARQGHDRRGFVPSLDDTSNMKFRHVFFQPKDPADEYAADDPIHSWPTHSTPARNFLQEIVEHRTHSVNPLHAYDPNGQLIPPQLYRTRLQGATARIHFVLSHTYFKNFNNFTADIHSIRVLHPPSPPSPAKRLPESSFDDPLLSMKGKRARK